jgi:acetylornithine/N-succinyldiaminopimelate aminotransferase
MTIVPPILPIYRRTGVRIVRGEGMYLIDDSGRKILDFAAGIAVNAFGHNHSHLVAALQKQGATLWHCSNQFITPELEQFAARLVENTFADSVFFCSSGTEAVEAGIKFLRRYHYARGEAYRTRIITFEGGFHGRTYAGISAGGNESARAGFRPLLPGFDRVAFNDIEAVRRAVTKNTAGILLEAIQGEGGIRAFDLEVLRQIRALCDAEGILLMCDEVQCGYGRPGKFFAFERAGIVPDIVTSAKGIGAGFPLAATLVREHVAETLTPGCHGSTYGANPLAMAVGNAALDLLLAPGLFAQIEARGAHLREGLARLCAAYPHLLKEVRGVGLLVGLVPQSQVDARALSAKMLEGGLATSPSVSNVIRFVPPLIVSEKEVDEALAMVEEALKHL